MQNVFRGVRRSLLSSLNLGIFLYLTGVGGLMSLAHSATPASTLIQNTATVDYVVFGTPGTTLSNTYSFLVDELISFTLVSNNPSGVSAISPETNAVLSYQIANQGNGDEDFSLSTSQSVSDDFNATAVKIYLDANANNLFDDGVDTLYSVGVNDPLLAMNASLYVFIVSDIPAALNSGDRSKITLSATSKTGAGPMGTIYSGLGQGGVDALMGTQGGVISVEAEYFLSAATGTLTKSQVILDPIGGSAAVPNAIITYTLSFETSGTGTLTGVQIRDVIPAGTAYVAGSMQLDTAPLTDAALDDAGVFLNGTEVLVTIPTVIAPTTRTVSFRVRIL